jgi:hypothetical protein
MSPESMNSSSASSSFIGHSVFNRPAALPLKICAKLIDFFMIMIISFISLYLLNIIPTPSVSMGTLFIGTAVFYLAIQKIYLGATCGEYIWQLRAIAENTKKKKLYQRSRITLPQVFVGSLLTTFCALGSVTALNEIALKHPVWTVDSVWKITPFVPPEGQWLITPFFYALGAWPKDFEGRTVLYSIPYEKGPPTRFVGHIFADLESPDIQLILEGPKTPENSATQMELKNCFTKSSSYHCLVLREKSLFRHLKEIHFLAPKAWKIQWFLVDNPFLPPEHQPQGVYLSADGGTSIQDRFIIVNSNGTHQAIILNRPKTQRGELAFELIQKSIRSLRVFNELNSAKAWVNREIESVRLSELQQAQKATQLEADLAGIQSLLISRISVDPASFDSYYHLAGTSLLLTQKAAHARDGTSLAATRNAQSAFQFASDLAPHDPRTAQIQNLMHEIKKR